MAAQRINLWNFVFVVLLIGAATPAAVYHAVQGRPAQALLATAGALLGVLVVVAELTRGRAPVVQPGPEMLDAVIAPPVPVMVKVVATRGICPQGYRPGSFWAVDPQGHVTPTLCRPAIVALGSLLQGFPNSQGRQATCNCPHGYQEVAFTVMKA